MALTMNKYICTSVDDCRGSIHFVTDIDFLRQLLAECEKIGHTSRAAVVRSRIRHLERNADHAKN